MFTSSSHKRLKSAFYFINQICYNNSTINNCNNFISICIEASNLSSCFVFLLSCNRHTDEMINKLESAGLGYRVKAEETDDRLGRTA